MLQTDSPSDINDAMEDDHGSMHDDEEGIRIVYSFIRKLQLQYIGVVSEHANEEPGDADLPENTPGIRMYYIANYCPFNSHVINRR
jgi:hypothetical protein